MTTRERSEGTREAIRAAASVLFAQKGFDATGVRDIAAAAGVNPALVIRHFGSKEGLFLRAMVVRTGTAELLDTPIEELGPEMVRWAVRARGPRLAPLAALLGASQRPEVRNRLEEILLTSLVPRVASLIEGPEAELRAHLFAAQLLGLMTTLALEFDPFLRDADEERIVAVYGRSLQQILTG